MDIIGKTFNHLKVLEYVGKNKHKKKMFKCHCSAIPELLISQE